MKTPRLLIGLAVLSMAFRPTLAGERLLEAAAIEIVGTTPLAGVGLAREQIPGPVQVAGGLSLDGRGAVNLPDFMNRSLGSVHINDIQGNPFQPDVSYRGYTASPLLGTPQGLSVYVDGVRFNQPFGDVVSWDLLPRSAMASLALIPGSNPVFGLNTLGGAISIRTKDGLSHPGTALQAIYGSHQRQVVEFEQGGRNDHGLHWFASGTAFREEGWREASPTRIGQLFGKLGWIDARSELALTVAVADNRLTGNGLQEQRLLEQDTRSVYSKPDETANRSLLLNLTAQHSVNDELMLSGNATFRRLRTLTVNGDVNEGSLDQSVYQLSAAERSALTSAGYRGLPSGTANAGNTPFPYWRCLANVLRSDEPAEKCTGLINRSRTAQDHFGLSGQLTLLGQVAGQSNQFTAGAGYEASRMNFRQSAQFGYLNPDHSITPVNFFADGREIDDSGQAIDSRVSLAGRTRTWSLYGTDTLSMADVWHLTLAARYNHTRIRNRDQITPGGGSGSLDGDASYRRLNPAIGLAYSPSPAISAYAGYNEGSRTPTAIELGCADPANPCKLPNAMAGDPPLKQVVSRTREFGLRGMLAGATHWNAGIFRAENFDDILFVADQQAGFGYFRNFGKTRRQGVELGVDSELGKFTWAAHYTYLRATYQSRETVNASANSSNDAASPGLAGNIAITPGDDIPLMPRHVFKARADYRFTEKWSAELGLVAVSGAYARGNENNRHQPDGVHYLGSGKSAGYAVFDLGAKYHATPQLSFFGQLNNLFDRRYVTAAQLGSTAFASSGNFVARPFPAAGGEYPLAHAGFSAPGAPRSLWIGVRYAFDK